MAISRADVDRVLNLISSKDIETLKSEDFEIFQYQGFDPIKLATALLKIKKDKNISDNDFSADVFKMVAIGMIKGSVNEHNKSKMSDAGQASVSSLNERYGIKLGGGRGQGSSVITYPRVMATFPDIAVRMTKVIGGKEFRGGPLLSTRLPEFMKIQVFPSLIPKNINRDVKSMLMAACLCYSIDQTVQISRMDKPDLKQLASSQGNFVMIGHQSPVPADPVRRTVFIGLAVGGSYKRIVSVLNDYKKLIDDSFTIMDETAFITEVTKYGSEE